MKIYKTLVRQVMLHGLERAALTKRQEAELEVAELKMNSSYTRKKGKAKIIWTHIEKG